MFQVGQALMEFYYIHGILLYPCQAHRHPLRLEVSNASAWDGPAARKKPTQSSFAPGQHNPFILVGRAAPAYAEGAARRPAIFYNFN